MVRGRSLIYILLALLATGLLIFSLSLSSKAGTDLETVRVELTDTAGSTLYEFSCSAQASLCERLQAVTAKTYSEQSDACEVEESVKIELLSKDGSSASHEYSKCGQEEQYNGIVTAAQGEKS